MNQVYEYKILYLNSIQDHQMLEINLNILGQQGWDLIFIEEYKLFLKRKTLPISLTDHDPQPVEIREEI